MDYRASIKEDPTKCGMIVDLSRHANKLLDGEDISDDLSPEEEQKICSYIQTISEMSFDKISR